MKLDQSTPAFRRKFLTKHWINTRSTSTHNTWGEEAIRLVSTSPGSTTAFSLPSWCLLFYFSSPSDTKDQIPSVYWALDDHLRYLRILDKKGGNHGTFSIWLQTSPCNLKAINTPKTRKTCLMWSFQGARFSSESFSQGFHQQISHRSTSTLF